MRTFRDMILAASLAGILTACAVGPDFKAPGAPDVKRYTETELPSKTAATDGAGGAAQSFLPAKDVPHDWWKEFGSEPLNQLVEQALKASPDLKAADAALRQAQENYYAARGDLLPDVDASFATTRQKFNPSAFGSTSSPSSIFTLYNASVSVSYSLDVFGGTRRSIEAARAQADTQRYEHDAAYLSLTANVVTTAIAEASLRQQLKETQNIIDIETKQLDVIKKQFDLGSVPKLSVLQQQATLAQTQAAVPALEKQLAQTRSQLAVLAGKLPGEGTDETFELDGLHLPEELPLTLPSKLVEQRPDIKAASEQLHMASAEIGVATANMLPQINLTGTYGSETTSFSKLFTSGAEVWSVGGGLLQPVFHGGSLLHSRRAAVAAYDKVAAQYQSTVLLAFKNVSDTLRALQFDAEGLNAQASGEQAAKSSLDLAQSQFKEGAISYPQLLDAQRLYSQARISLVQAVAARFADTAALYQALGGGWENETTAKPATPATTDMSPAVPAAAVTAPAAETTPPSAPETKASAPAAAFAATEKPEAATPESSGAPAATPTPETAKPAPVPGGPAAPITLIETQPKIEKKI